MGGRDSLKIQFARQKRSLDRLSEGVTLGLRPVTVKLNFRLYFNQDGGGGGGVRTGKVENRVSRTISLFKSILLIVRRDNALN